MDLHDDIWYLQNVDLYKNLCPTKVANRTSGGKEMVTQLFSKGEYIFQPGDAANSIYLLEEGRVKVGAYSDSGREIIKTILKPGEIFGELVILGDKKHRDYALALDSVVKVCALTFEELKEVMVDDTDFGLRVTRMIGLRLERTERRLESLVFKDARTRIIEFLLELAEKVRVEEKEDVLVKNFFTHKDIASLTATSRQTVTSILNDLREKGMISFSRKQLEIHNLSSLSSLK